MKKVSRAILFSVLTLILLVSACTLPAQTPPTPLVTIPATEPVTLPATPTSTPSNETPTAFIPITGMDVVSLQCQFCVNEEAHAVLIMSDQVFFNVSDPSTGVTCLTAQEVNGRRILLCRGAQQASFQLNVCVDDANCLQFPITFQTCPLIPQNGLGTPVITFTPVAPILLTAINTLIPEEETEEPQEPPTPRPTRTPGVTPPPGPTSTVEPPPTEESTEPPPPTEEPTDPPETQEPTEPPIDPPSSLSIMKNQ